MERTTISLQRQQGACYGDYVKVNINDVPQAKNALLEGMIDTIRELAKRDDFWIVKPDTTQQDVVSVAWKIYFSQMKLTQDDYKL